MNLESNRNWGQAESLPCQGSNTIFLLQQSFSRKKLSWGTYCHHPNSKRESYFLFFWDKLDSTFEFEFFDRIRVSSLRLTLNGEESTWLDHSRFLVSLSTCIHESFAKNYFDISCIWALKKCMSFTNTTYVHVSLK